MNIVAHRFYTENLPENTLEAFQRARELGADVLVLDVHLTRDLVPVVHYGVYLTDTPTPQRPIFDTTSDELKQIPLLNQYGDVVGDHHIHRLYEILGTLGSKTRFELEIKCPQPEIVSVLSELLRDFRYLWHTFEVSSTEPILLRAVQEQCPELATDLIYPRTEAGWGADVLAHYALHHARLANTKTIHLHPSQLSAEVVETLRKNDLEVHAYEVNRAFEFQLVQQLGITRFSTEQLKLALTYRK